MFPPLYVKNTLPTGAKIKFMTGCNHIAVFHLKLQAASELSWSDTVKLAFASIFVIFLAVAGFAQTPQPAADAAIKDVYLAKDDGSGKAGEPVTAFSTTDIPIHCVVLLDEAGVANVKMNFVAVSVPGVKPETKVVSTSYTTTDTEDRVNFTGRPAKLWVTGKYRLDIFLDGKFVKNVPFDIQKPQPATGSAELIGPKQQSKSKAPGRYPEN